MVVEALKRIGGVQSDYRVGDIRRSVDGLYSLWVRSDLERDLLVVKERWFQVGWARARVRLLEDRPLQCYRCLNFGRAATACNSLVLTRKGRRFWTAPLVVWGKGPWREGGRRGGPSGGFPSFGDSWRWGASPRRAVVR